MLIEDTSVIWDEEISPFQTVATNKVDNQNIDNPESLADCERSSLNLGKASLRTNHWEG